MRDGVIEHRLLEWAAWVTVKGGNGYPVTNVLHQSWMPPAPGTTPTLKALVGKDHQHRQTHRAIGTLSVRLANTIVVHYCFGLRGEAAGLRLQCAESTVRHRIREAHRRIALWLVEDA